MRQERRKSPRILAEHLVSYTILDGRGETDEMGMARTLDLSEGGLVLEMTHPLDEGTTLELNMVSANRIVQTKGRSVYCRAEPSNRWRVGVCFTDITESDLTTIAQEVEQRRKEETGGNA